MDNNQSVSLRSENGKQLEKILTLFVFCSIYCLYIFIFLVL